MLGKREILEAIEKDKNERAELFRTLLNLIQLLNREIELLSENVAEILANQVVERELRDKVAAPKKEKFTRLRRVEPKVVPKVKPKTKTRTAAKSNRRKVK